MNTLQKFVFSATLDKVEWQNSTLVKTDVIEKIRTVKKSGRDKIIFGSASLLSGLMLHGLANTGS
jgi:dihydrofolate reductase